MKTIVTLSLALIVTASAPLLVQPQTGNAEKQEILNLLLQHDAALNRQDLPGLLTLYAPGARSVVLGTGTGERYQGHDQIRDAYSDFFKDFDKGSQVQDCYWKDGGVSGDSAWLAATCKFTDIYKKKFREYERNLSAVLQKTSGKWQFTVLHFSQLIGAPEGKAGRR